jgi:probable HAF family extracellular repeat protein
MAQRTRTSFLRPTSLGILGGRLRHRAVVVSALLFILVGVLLAGCDETVLTNPQHAFLWQGGAMTDLGTLGGTSSLAYGISSKGQVTGWAQTAAGNTHAFMWTAGKMKDLGTLGGSKSVGRDINGRGQVVGWSTTSSGYEHAFFWYRGHMTDLGTLGGDESRAYGIDELGYVVGWAEAPDGNKHACLWSGSTMTDLGTLADVESQAFAVQLNVSYWSRGSAVVAGSQGIDSPVAVVWKNGQAQTIGAFPSGAYSKAYGMNCKGQVVGEADTDSSFNYPHPFIWKNGVMQDLGLLDGTNWGRAYAVNSWGDCAGECQFGTLGPSPSSAVAWLRGQIVDLGRLPGGNQAIAYDINDWQQVVGTSEYAAFPGVAPGGSFGQSTETVLSGIRLDTVVTVHLVGTDAAGRTVYDTKLSRAALQRAIAGGELDPAPPAGTVRLTAEVTYVDAGGVQQTKTIDYPLPF